MKLKKNHIFVVSLVVTVTAAAIILIGSIPAEHVAAIGQNTASAPIVPLAHTARVITTGLNNPRGLNFSPDGSLYVAEAGTGGPGPCGVTSDGNLNCYGATGSITRINFKRGTATRVAEGLPSIAPADGNGALGPHDIVFNGEGKAVISIGFGSNPAQRFTDFAPVGGSLARLVRLRKNGRWTLSADIGAYEASADPNADGPDCDPYGLLASSNDNDERDNHRGWDGRDGDDDSTILTDAGGNDLLKVDEDGNVSTLAVFPNRNVEFPPGNPNFSMDEVPTTVARGRDGALYVGQLTGFPFPVGGARVYRVPARGGTPTIYASGFTNIIDIAFGRDGSMYVLEIAKNGLLGAFGPPNDFTGAIIRVRRDGSRTEIAPGRLFAPGGIAIGRDGSLYVTNKSILNGGGEVLRIEQ